MWTGRRCRTCAAPPRGSRADRREVSSLTNVTHVGRLMGQKHRSSIDASRLRVTIWCEILCRGHSLRVPCEVAK